MPRSTSRRAVGMLRSLGRTVPAKPIFSKPFPCWRPAVAFAARHCRAVARGGFRRLDRCRRSRRCAWRGQNRHRCRARRDGESGRKLRINGANASSAGALSDHLRIVWLTPSMDGLFSGSAGDRRRFLDRLVLAVDPDHGTRVSAFERALRSRNKLLEEPSSDPRWLDAIEREIAELAVSIAAARIDTVGRLSALIAETRDDDDAFPHAEIALGGWMEAEIEAGNAADVEDAYRVRLRELRRSRPCRRPDDRRSSRLRSLRRARSETGTCRHAARRASRRRCCSAWSSPMRAW